MQKQQQISKRDHARAIDRTRKGRETRLRLDPDHDINPVTGRPKRR